MKVTAKLKSWLIEHESMPEDAEDADAKKAATAAMLEDRLTPEKYAELVADEDAEKASKLESFMKSVDDRMKALETKSVETGDKGGVSSIERMFAKAPEIREKSVKELYSTSRSDLRYPEKTAKGGRHPRAGEVVRDGQRAMQEASEFDMACSGAFIKFSIWSSNGCRNSGIPRAFLMSEHDHKLIQHMLHEEKWVGVIGGQGSEDDGAQGLKVPTLLSAAQRKAVLDDATSGGLELAPIVFDDAIIQTPLLFGEFAPKVTQQTITRGRRIEGGSIGNVTFSSGGADGTAIPLFNTANFISAFDTSIFVANGSIEIGLDFLSDSPVDVAGVVAGQYGRQLLTWLDTQIVSGDGTTEPEGVVNASGTVTVNADNGATGPPTVNDYEDLLFGVTKAFKQGWPSDRIGYGGTETSYQRARGIAVGGSDARRVFGMDHESYMLFDHPYGINESLTNRQVIFGVWPRYRLYRRAGLQIRTTTEGKTLVRGNLMLMTARHRCGGQAEDGSAFAVQADGQS